jgi:Rrf2 family protein
MLSTTSEYALRALTVLAALPQGASMLGRDLARHTGIPGRYLAKVLTTLHNAGMVGTARGSNGGYWLSRSPDSIHMQEVVALFDSAAMRRSCLLWPGRACSEDHPCSAHTSWKAVRDAYLRFLENVTVADISERPGGTGPQPNVLGGFHG